MRIGVCSWADEGMVKHWYPRGVSSAADRLRYYADHFDVVEVDSPFYALPSPETAQKWAERTPPDFTFHVKASGEMTGHREAEREQAFREFRDALAPLERSGKMRGVLLQYHPRVKKSRQALDELVAARDLLDPLVPLVEFRHRSWLEPDEQADTLAFLEQHGLAYVSVDAPRTRASNVVPSIAAATHPVAYVRFHGRNWKTWNIRNARTSGERFDWRYSEEELAEWVEPLAAARRAGRGGIRALQQQPLRLRAVGRPAAAAPARLGRSACLGRNRARRPRPATVRRRMRILSIVHGSNVPPGVFGDEAERGGHEVDTWSLAWGTPPPAPIDDYGAVMIFGGSMHADQDDRHPWLREENFFLQRLLDLHIPVLGVCLGAQLIAKAAHAEVKRDARAGGRMGGRRADRRGRRRSAVLGAARPLPGLPVALLRVRGAERRPGARAERQCCTQAFRLGDWPGAVQFHPGDHPVDPRRLAGRGERDEVPGPPEEILAEFDRQADEWEAFGRALCGNFVEAAERVAVTA